MRSLTTTHKDIMVLTRKVDLFTLKDSVRLTRPSSCKLQQWIGMLNTMSRSLREPSLISFLLARLLPRGTLIKAQPFWMSKEWYAYCLYRLDFWIYVLILYIWSYCIIVLYLICSIIFLYIGWQILIQIDVELKTNALNQCTHSAMCA